MKLLLDQGLDTKTVIQLCFKEQDKIITRLKNGEVLIDILCDGQTLKLFKILHVLAKHMSFKQALTCAERIDNSSNTISYHFFKKIAYPIFIFCFAYFMIIFFSRSIIPSMMLYSNGENSFLLLDLLKILFTLLFICMVVLLVLMFMYVKVPVFKEKIIPYLLKNKIYQLYVTIQFSIVLESLLASNLTSKSCFQILSKMNYFKEVHYFGNRIYQELLEGKRLETIINTIPFDKTFLVFFKIGMKSADLVTILKVYYEQAIKSFKTIVNKLIVTMQVFSYSCVGILVLVVYQIMLLPLNMLNTI